MRQDLKCLKCLRGEFKNKQAENSIHKIRDPITKVSTKLEEIQSALEKYYRLYTCTLPDKSDTYNSNIYFFFRSPLKFMTKKRPSFVIWCPRSYLLTGGGRGSIPGKRGYPSFVPFLWTIVLVPPSCGTPMHRI